MTNDSRAARALLAYYNHQMANKLVRHVLKTASPAAQARLTDELLDMIPRAAHAIMNSRVEQLVTEYAGKFVAGKEYSEKIAKHVEARAELLLKAAFDKVIEETAAAAIHRHVKSYEGQSQAKLIPGAFMAAINREIERVAVREVADRKEPAAAED